jgi:hypothetical protein
MVYSARTSIRATPEKGMSTPGFMRLVLNAQQQQPPSASAASLSSARREVGFALFSALEALCLRLNCAAGAVLLAEDVTLASGGAHGAHATADASVSAAASPNSAPLRVGVALPSAGIPQVLVLKSGMTSHVASAHSMPRYRSVAVVEPAVDEREGTSPPAPASTAGSVFNSRRSSLGLAVANANVADVASMMIPYAEADDDDEPPAQRIVVEDASDDGEHQFGDVSRKSSGGLDAHVDALELLRRQTPAGVEMASRTRTPQAESMRHAAAHGAIRFRTLTRVGQSKGRAYGDLAMQLGCWSSGIAVNYESKDGTAYLCLPIESLHAGMSHLGIGIGAATRSSASESFPYCGLLILSDKNAAPRSFTPQDEATAECITAVFGSVMSRYPATVLLDAPYEPGSRFSVGTELPRDKQLPDYVASALARQGHGPRRKVLRTSTSTVFPRRNITQGTFDVPGLSELTCLARYVEEMSEVVAGMRSRLLHLEAADSANQRRLQALSKEVLDAQQKANRQSDIAAHHDHAARLLREELVAKTVGRAAGGRAAGGVVGGGGEERQGSPARPRVVPTEQLEQRAASVLAAIQRKVADRDKVAERRVTEWREAFPDAAMEFDIQRLAGAADPATPRVLPGTSLLPQQRTLLQHPPPRPPTFFGLPGQSNPTPRPRRPSSSSTSATVPRNEEAIAALRRAIASEKVASPRR